MGRTAVITLWEVLSFFCEFCHFSIGYWNLKEAFESSSKHTFNAILRLWGFWPYPFFVGKNWSLHFSVSLLYFWWHCFNKFLLKIHISKAFNRLRLARSVYVLYTTYTMYNLSGLCITTTFHNIIREMIGCGCNQKWNTKRINADYNFVLFILPDNF